MNYSKMVKNEFKKALGLLETVTSIKIRKVYHSIHVSGNDLVFTRQHKTKPERIDIDELYSLYSTENKINTSIAKKYISGRVQSPAVAIINSLKFSDIPITHNAIKDKEVVNTPVSSNKASDENRFFQALSELVGENFILSKNIGKPITSSNIFLSNNYLDYGFNKEVVACYEKILTALHSDKQFDSASLSHNIDGLILNHPQIKNRIVEFDEEQHFSPARKDTLDSLNNVLSCSYIQSYQKICQNLNYMNDRVLKKHRIKNRLKVIPKTFGFFIKWLELSGEKSSGYICSKNGFDFLGGRIAQRAYYDCLRDTAHLSDKNNMFESPLRFAKKDFEDITLTDFKHIPFSKIKSLIHDQLKNDYGISV